MEENFYDCKSCGCKGFRDRKEPLHEEICLSKTVMFMSKTKNNTKRENDKYKINNEISFVIHTIIYIYY